ncbi:MAG TPA: hypothetical protein VK817_12140 [Trebonia sp.]|jgi:hypothetical protein|nr:hypothetical protein [Trebonia sp.]
MDEPDAGTYADKARAYAYELRREADAVERCPEILSVARIGDDLYDDAVQFVADLDGWSGTLDALAHELIDLEVPGDDSE